MLRYMNAKAIERMTSWPDRFRAWRRFWRSYGQYQELSKPHAKVPLSHLYPCIGDDTTKTPIEPIYFYQDAWAFEKIVTRWPSWHVDVGSHHKYVALLSKVVPVTMVDLRPLSLPLETLQFRMGSIVDLPYENSSVPSVSSLCVIEHVGLGRYGDPLNPRGSEQAIRELKRIVQPGGDLYISLTLDDDDRTYFNAHRVFREDSVLEWFKPFQVVERRYIYGEDFGAVRKRGFGVGCYHLRCVP